MQLTNVSSVPNEFKTKLPLDDGLLQILKTTPDGYKEEGPTLRKPITLDFNTHTRKAIWRILTRTARTLDGWTQSTVHTDVPVTHKGKLNTASRFYAVGSKLKPVSPSLLFGRHSLGMDIPEIEIRTDVSNMVARTIETFVTTYGEGLECRRFAVFINDGSVFIRTKFD